MSFSSRAFNYHTLILIGILLVAALFRFHGLDWDAGQHQHPDERHISDVMNTRLSVPPQHDLAGLLDPGASDFNPRSTDPATGRPRQFAYGSLPLLLTEAVACAADRLTGHACPPQAEGEPYWTTYQHQYLIGRGLTALADLALIVVTALLAWRAFGATAGLIAAAFLAVSTINIQLAHFFATDTWSALFATAALWALYRAADHGPGARWHTWALAGVMIGASIASKPNTMSLAVPAVIALWFSARGPLGERLAPIARRGIMLGLATLSAFAVLEPYALPTVLSALQPGAPPGPPAYIRDFLEQADIIGGKWDVPYTRQFVGALPVWHYAWNLWGYGLGAGLTLLGAAGLVASAWRAVRQRTAIDWLLLGWFLSYGLVINTVFAKFARYTLPLVPVLAILGAGFAVQLGAQVWPRRDRLAAALTGGWRVPTAAWRLLVLVLLLMGLVQALAFSSIYRQAHTRVAASDWIYATVPKGSAIAAETWDDSLPLALADGRHPGAYGYRFVEANHYHDRSPAEGLADIERILSESDYIITSSQRIYGSTDRLPWRYPIVNRYYDLLFAERLGFTLVYTNTLQPALGPFQLDSRWADESFSVYDHPPVHIFAKQYDLTPDHLDALFAEAATQRPLVSRTPPEDRSLLLSEPLWTWPDLSGEAWAGPAGSSWWALARWLVALGLIGVAGVPWSVILFRRLADSGVGMARTLSLLLVAYLIWIGASLRWAEATAGMVLAWTVAVGGLGWLILARRPALLAEFRGRWQAVLVTEAVFWAGFGLALLLRLANPDLWQPWWGGEKPMESAFLNAVLRSAYFPPYDPWFSGGYINYYYFGFVLVSVPIKLVGVATAIGFNLALATLFGLVAASACSLGQTLTQALAGRERPPRLAVVSAGGVGAAVLTLGIGNLDGAIQVIQRWSGAIGSFDFWRSSRAIQYVITEFPYFSFLYGDLHAHVIAMPLALLVMGLGLSLVLAPRLKATGADLVRQVPWPIVGAAGLALGALATTNAWDVPAYTGLFAGAAFIAAPFGRRAIIARLAWAGGIAVLTAGLAYLLYLPFFRAFQSFYGSIDLTRIPTQLHEFLVVWGYLLALVLIVALVLVVTQVEIRSLHDLRWPVVAVVVLTGLATGAVLARGLWGPTLVFPLIGLLLIAWLHGRLTPVAEYVVVMLIGALAIVTGVEFVYLVDFLQGGDWYRMNTVFKLYLEAWLLLAVGLAGGLAVLWRLRTRAHLFVQALVATIIGGGLLASLAYPVFVTSDRLEQRFEARPGPTLNGLAFMEVGTLRDHAGAVIAFDEDLSLIQWMQTNLRGTPVIVEAMIGPYRGNGSRITNATGFPTVLGWDNHEGQQRWPEAIGPRSGDVRRIYTSETPAEVLALLEQYDVDYIVVGQVEQRTTLRRGHLGAVAENEPYASAGGLATLRSLAAQGALAVAFEEGETVLYRVVRPLAFPGEQIAQAVPDPARLAEAAR